MHSQTMAPWAGDHRQALNLVTGLHNAINRHIPYDPFLPLELVCSSLKSAKIPLIPVRIFSLHRAHKTLRQ